MINYSGCQYLHRALETWNAPPDFFKASEIMKTIKVKNVIYGMFLAEAIKKMPFIIIQKKKDFLILKKCAETDQIILGEKKLANPA